MMTGTTIHRIQTRKAVTVVCVESGHIASARAWATHFIGWPKNLRLPISAWHEDVCFGGETLACAPKHSVRICTIPASGLHHGCKFTKLSHPKSTLIYVAVSNIVSCSIRQGVDPSTDDRSNPLAHCYSSAGLATGCCAHLVNIQALQLQFFVGTSVPGTDQHVWALIFVLTTAKRHAEVVKR